MWGTSLQGRSAHGSQLSLRAIVTSIADSIRTGDRLSDWIVEAPLPRIVDWSDGNRRFARMFISLNVARGSDLAGTAAIAAVARKLPLSYAKVNQTKTNEEPIITGCPDGLTALGTDRGRDARDTVSLRVNMTPANAHDHWQRGSVLGIFHRLELSTGGNALETYDFASRWSGSLRRRSLER